jgi:hypothetical protein
MKTDFINRLNELGIKYCFNEQTYDFSKLKFIIVGDNPGDTEYEKKRFFIGPSGQKLRNHFQTYELVENFDNECIIYNKTFISTTKTNDLKHIKESIGREYFDSIQIYCAKEIATVSNEFKLPILVFGKRNLSPNFLFESFWKALNKASDNKENILVFKHPSYNHFFKEWDDKLKDQIKIDSSIDLLRQIGTFNSRNINIKYQIQ